ncbi:MAG: DNA gyrase subunit B, partial [Magnetococcales bacterium]|nr:DNA gyrase subunit B [Magnetococcales bacterium]
KILNVEKARFDKMLASAEVGTLISALGTGIGSDEYDINKLRYHHIIIMTDADVDGAHIRALLLTFFYRHFQEIITRGYLYIAQPPLYRVATRGNKELYLKDETALNALLLSHGLADITLQTEQGTLREAALESLLADAQRFVTLLDRLSYHYDRLSIATAVEQVHLNPDDLAQPSRMESAAVALQDLLQARAGDAGQVQVMSQREQETNTEAIIVRRTVYGLPQETLINGALLRSSEYREMSELAVQLHRRIGSNALFCKGERKIPVPNTLEEMVSWVMGEGRKGLTIQRYKGLGEMNPVQLWETTMDPNVRSLLQVRIEDIVAADEVFTTLMGDAVEPRRDFIQSNALRVSNLDV